MTDEMLSQCAAAPIAIRVSRHYEREKEAKSRSLQQINLILLHRLLAGR
jgi:hypothetical protein